MEDCAHGQLDDLEEGKLLGSFCAVLELIPQYLGAISLGQQKKIGPSEVHATSGATYVGHYFLVN